MCFVIEIVSNCEQYAHFLISLPIINGNMTSFHGEVSGRQICWNVTSHPDAPGVRWSLYWMLWCDFSFLFHMYVIVSWKKPTGYCRIYLMVHALSKNGFCDIKPRRHGCKMEISYSAVLAWPLGIPLGNQSLQSMCQSQWVRCYSARDNAYTVCMAQYSNTAGGNFWLCTRWLVIYKPTSCSPCLWNICW